jgi:hypothetical protein
MLGNAFAVHDVELDLRNGGATLFLTTLTRVWFPTTSSRSLIATDAANIKAHRGVELQRITACRGFGTSRT